ncbi:serine/threonine-protein kinase Nek3 isoform X2 [Alosa sapidissima]|uniref:serine/threonine-protein kinase Nek3 isoform X2 n=1 Tax=Alosa sapidissima TaxID=34773 RepID=UPI001C091E86|nr:serine/threonine-protein kinase Nek3 isoform X2 [Alosa sapidissima]
MQPLNSHLNVGLNKMSFFDTTYFCVIKVKTTTLVEAWAVTHVLRHLSTRNKHAHSTLPRLQDFFVGMDDYKILKVIGEGSFGRALLVQHKNCETKWVLKEIQIPKARSGAQSRREAVLLAKMKHPNIVAFKDSFEADGYLYIAMEFCGGGDLLQRIRLQKNAHFSEDVVLKWFAQMCSGAKHIHDKRVLHRDLKSKNIFLTDNGTVKLGDFGSACLLSSAEGCAQTYVGTPYYVSPEIWDSKPYNNKSDVWSLGCVLYELCTLKHPFQACSWKSLILKVCRGAYDPLPKHLPYELHYLIKHMFKTNPRDRPSVQTILTSHRISRLLQKHLQTPEKPQTERVQRWRREDGKAVAKLLGQKTLLTASTVESTFGESHEGELRPRRRWAAGPSETVLEVLKNADVISSDSMPIGDLEACSESLASEAPQKRERRRWDREPPQRLLSLLEKASLSTAFKTYTIHRKGTLRKRLILTCWMDWKN